MQHLNFCREIKPYLGLEGVKLQAPGFSHKSDLYGKVTEELGQKIQNFDGLGLKITIAKNFLAMSAEALQNVNHSR
jgi:hypothetical protein